MLVKIFEGIESGHVGNFGHIQSAVTKQLSGSFQPDGADKIDGCHICDRLEFAVEITSA